MSWHTYTVTATLPIWDSLSLWIESVVFANFSVWKHFVFCKYLVQILQFGALCLSHSQQLLVALHVVFWESKIRIPHSSSLVKPLCWSWSIFCSAVAQLLAPKHQRRSIFIQQCLTNKSPRAWQRSGSTWISTECVFALDRREEKVTSQGSRVAENSSLNSRRSWKAPIWMFWVVFFFNGPSECDRTSPCPFEKDATCIRRRLTVTKTGSECKRVDRGGCSVDAKKRAVLSEV